MPCYRVHGRPMTLGEAKDRIGAQRGPDRIRGESDASFARRQREWAEAEDEEMLDLGPVFLCGDIEITMCKEPGCLREHEVLCDWPMGRGKTCDIELCVDHAKHIGEEKDLCPIHFAMWVAKSGVTRLNPWPPHGKGARR